jgi:enterochelin esterase-like enzyme
MGWSRAVPLSRLLHLMVCLAAVFAWLAPGSARGQSLALSGFLFDDTLWSPILQQQMPYRVYLPPGYFDDDARRYPTLYMLHGAGGNYTEWSDSYLPEQVDDMIDLQFAQPMIVVMPDGGSRTFWANWDQGPLWSEYVAQDVVAEIDTRFRTLASPASRAIGGLSMGGLGALQIGMRHPDVFGVVGGHSPSVRLEWDEELWFLSPASFEEQNPIWLAANHPGVSNIVYWIDVGADDWWRPNIEQMRAVFVANGLNVSWRLFSGTHEAEYWIEHVPDYLRFYSNNLRS